MKFLGTGAGEGTPNPFCTCRICENARKIGGREIRMRSSFMLDSHTVIDIGADYFAQSALYSAPLTDVTDVLFTHMHDDHINYTFIWERFVKRSERTTPLNIYLTEEAYSYFSDFYFTSRLTKNCNPWFCPENVNIIRLEYGRQYTVGDYKVTAVPANHFTAFEENGANYLIEKNGKALFYAVDSGMFTSDAYKLLKGRELNSFIGECTFPTEDKYVNETGSHMDISMCIKNLDILYDSKAITENTKIYLTHISPFSKTHAELTEYMQRLDRPYRVNVAYDNLSVDLL